MSARAVPYLQVACAAMAWGTWSLILRPAGVDPRWSSAIMLAVVTVACAPMLLRARARAGSFRRPRDWWLIVAMGIFDAANAGLFFAAMDVTTVAVAVLSHYLAPVFVALAAPRWLGTQRSARTVGLALAALFGLALVLEPWRLAGEGAGSVILGSLLGAGSAVFYAANVILTKRMGPRFTAEEQLVYHAVISALVLTVFAVATHARIPTSEGATRVALAAIVLGATAGLLFLYGLRRIAAEHAGILTFLEPLTAVLVAWLAWGERPGLAALIGGAIVVAAGIAAIREPPPTVDRTVAPAHESAANPADSGAASRSTAA